MEHDQVIKHARSKNTLGYPNLRKLGYVLRLIYRRFLRPDDALVDLVDYQFGLSYSSQQHYVLLYSPLLDDHMY